jgi:glycosyltransferase A (GT-A) superfamily protein (DUF2064 family)
LLRGSDSPCLDRVTLGDAVSALSRSDLVVCPDRDGGYNLVGLGVAALANAAAGALFDHPMSTPHVLRETLARAGLARLRVESLEPGFDIDRFDDLRWLSAARRLHPSLPCPRTLAFLDERHLWPATEASAEVHASLPR